MKIRGFFQPKDNAPYISATVVQAAYHLSHSVSFLVDSGASATVIADVDVVRLGLDYDELQRLEEGMTGVGGTVETFVLPSVKLVFATDAEIHEEKLERIYLLRHRATDPRQRMRVEKIPSLLGRDVLNRYTVVLKQADDVVLITDEEEQPLAMR